MPFKIVRNDITKMQTEAIVNTANDHPTVGTGCDHAVYAAAGYDELLAYRQQHIGFVEEGDAFLTPGFGLPAKYIIHAVSPHYIDGRHGEEALLRSCYRKSLAIAAQNGIRSIAFPLISTGGFGYPKEEGMRIAVDEIHAFLLHAEMQVYLVVFDEKATLMGKSLYPDLEAYIDRNYVDEQRQEEYGDAYAYLRKQEEQFLQEKTLQGKRKAAERPSAGYPAASGGMPRPSAGRPADSEAPAMPSFARREAYPADADHTEMRRREMRRPAGRPAARDDMAWPSANIAPSSAPSPGKPAEKKARKSFGSIWKKQEPEKDILAEEALQAPALEDKEEKISFGYEDSVFESAILPGASYEDENAAIEKMERGLKERMKHLSDTFAQYLLYLIGQKGLTNADVYKKAIVDKKVFSKIKNNPDYHPQKLTALCLCIGAELNLDETRDLLARAGYALSPCDKTDIIFSYFIENRIYDMIELDIQLEEHGLPCVLA